MKGIAHVSFLGGGMFLPVRGPYDRQVLLEHVVDRARAKGCVQVLIDDERWLVHLRRGRAVDSCSLCGNALEAACYANAQPQGVRCLRCAFGDRMAPTQAGLEEQRRAS